MFIIHHPLLHQKETEPFLPQECAPVTDIDPVPPIPPVPPFVTSALILP